MKKILLVNSSSRKKSNSELLSKFILKDISYDMIDLKYKRIEPVKDYRFDSDWPNSKDDFYKLFDKFVKCDLIVISSPIYWYSISTKLKLFIDRWSEMLKVDNLFRQKMEGKKIILVLVGGDNPRIKSKIIIQQFKYICEFLNMKLIYSVVGKGNRYGEILNDKDALKKAHEVNMFLRKECN